MKHIDQIRTVPERFRDINLSDCELVGMRTLRNGKTSLDEVHFQLKLVAGAHADQRVHGELSFLECATLYVDIDFWEKHYAGDAIAEATCRKDPDGIASLDRLDSSRQQIQRLNEFWLFTISMVASGGTIRVLARDFMLTANGQRT